MIDLNRNKGSMASRPASTLPIWLLSILVICSLQVACIADFQSEEAAEFAGKFGLDGLDNAIDLELAEEDPDARSGDWIDLLAANRSEMSVWYPPDYGSRLFVRLSETDEWIEIDNQATYLGQGEILEPKSSGSENWGAVVSVSPGDFPVNDADVLRIVLVGRIATDGVITDNPTASYIDVHLQP